MAISPAPRPSFLSGYFVYKPSWRELNAAVAEQESDRVIRDGEPFYSSARGLWVQRLKLI
jgi:hypothetical protein